MICLVFYLNAEKDGNIFLTIPMLCLLDIMLLKTYSNEGLALVGLTTIDIQLFEWKRHS